MRDYHFGSPAHIRAEAPKYEDIIAIGITEEGPWATVNIIVKPNYDEDKIKEFINNTLPLSVEYKIIEDDGRGRI